jgi:hypothetical protein
MKRRAFDYLSLARCGAPYRMKKFLYAGRQSSAIWAASTGAQLENEIAE